MSGGVDSSAAACLVSRKQRAIGITLKLHAGRDEGDNPCCSLEAAADAKRLCRLLGMPHYTLDFQQLFQEKVVRDFVESYASGRTPNPCARCNEFIKFGPLLRMADQLGVKTMATGHYAKTRYNPETGRYELHRGADRAKDQSYFLYPLKQKELGRIRFPLGDFTKEEARRIVSEMDPKVAHKRESQELCFTGGGDYRPFLLRFVRSFPGAILDPEGRTLGKHKGAPFYTIGQRRGLGLAAGEPLYVKAVNAQENTLTVAPREACLVREVRVAELNWVSISKPSGPFSCEVQIRYRQRPVAATVEPCQEEVLVRFKEGVFAPAPGQAAVFYRGSLLLGGGTIQADRG